MLNTDNIPGNKVMSEDINFFMRNIYEDLVIEKKEIEFSEDDDPIFGGRFRVCLKEKHIASSICFMSRGWLSIEIFDWSSKELIANHLFEPQQNQEKRQAILHLRSLMASV